MEAGMTSSVPTRRGDFGSRCPVSDQTIIMYFDRQLSLNT